MRYVYVTHWRIVSHIFSQIGCHGNVLTIRTTRKQKDYLNIVYIYIEY